MLNYWPSMWGRPLSDSSWAKLVLFTVNETFLLWVGDGTHRPTVLRTLLLLYVGPFLQAQHPESHWNILYFGEGKKLYNNLRSVVLQLFLLLNLELSVDTSLSITWWNVLSEELERFVHVWANDTIYILMIFWEIMLLVCWRRWRRRGHSRWSGLHAKQREKRT